MEQPRHLVGKACAHVAAAALALALTVAPARATVDTRLVAGGLSSPVYATAPLADGRLFVVEKGGTIRLVQGAASSSFLSLSVATSGEQGLLGLAFDPGYANPASPGFRRFFVDYIDPANGDTVVASYLRSAANPNIADPASRVEILRVDQPAGLTNHKAGWIGFRPGDTSNLYIAVGDGGGSNDPLNSGQTRTTMLGKMLRVDINNDAFPADPNRNYAIPSTNPFVGAADGTLPEIYNLGLRNPWRNSFDMANGNLWIADVGQGAREEIDFIAAASTGGQNFGWRIREGDIATPGIGDPPVPGLTGPILVYDHTIGQSITGGYVVRDPSSDLYGRYVFADFVTGRIWHVAADGTPKTMADAVEITALLDAGGGGVLGQISSFGQGPSGELYIVDFGGGKVVQLVPEAPRVAMMALGLLVMGWQVRRRAARR
ncbi:MAG: PQQ-dependent sugar dehydrogenase [Rubrivivax sp.]|nr:PQQ-dependent sugar dehydrogenase [Rubrivivax sp.]